MATKAVNIAAFGGAHTAGIFSDMTVDGPVIGTLVVIMDRARNLPNKRTMGKQDPYCAARLGKEAKKTKTDKRGGQTPRWDQELRFTVHDSPDYHRLKVSVFNDDRKTELIGDTWVNLDPVLNPGGGQADDWHGLNNKGKYAGEVRIELTYYDTRPKADKSAPEKRREVARPEGESPAALGGPRGARESTPVKRRPLPTDPTGATPSPVNTPEHRGLRGIRAGPRELGSPRHAQPVEAPQAQRAHSETPTRRPVPEPAAQHAPPVSSQNTPQRPPMAQESYSTPPNPRSSNPRLPLPREESFDMSYAAPKAYEVQALDAVPQHVREHTHQRAMSQDDYHSRAQPQQQRMEPLHTHSAPVVPAQHNFEPQVRQIEYQQDRYAVDRGLSHGQDPYQDPAYQVAPLRTSRSREYSQEQPSPHDPYGNNRYIEAPPAHDVSPTHRRRSAMQPMVEDEDDLPPPLPVHRPGARTLPHPQQEVTPPSSYREEAPAPLNYSRRDEPAHNPYDMQQQQYASDSYSQHHSSERRYTYPRTSNQPPSRRNSGEAMAPSPLRTEAVALPSSLIAGLSPARQERDAPAYEAPPAYESQPRLRQYSEPAEYRAITQYETPEPSNQLVHHASSQYVYDYPHDPPEQPRRRSPVYDPIPIVKPRATSPAISPSPRHSPNPAADRTSRGPNRSMPTRKSVSPRPPPSQEIPEERRLSGVAFNPDSFDVYNPRVSKSPIPSDDEHSRPGSRMEYNDKGQIVTFSGRVVDASDHLPVDNWAPEPVPKGTVKEKAPRTRAQLNGSRDLEAARQREERYQRERAERERLRHSVSATFDQPSNALVTTRPHEYDDYETPGAGALVLAGQYSASPNSSTRNRYQSRSDHRQSMSSYDAIVQRHSPSVPASDSHVLRERHNPNSYGSSPSYGRYGDNRQSGPPIPAKIPIDMSGNYTGGNNEDMALSLELQSIDIGPASGGRRPRTQTQTRRQYGY